MITRSIITSQLHKSADTKVPRKPHERIEISFWRQNRVCVSSLISPDMLRVRRDRSPTIYWGRIELQDCDAFTEHSSASQPGSQRIFRRVRNRSQGFESLQDVPAYIIAGTWRPSLEERSQGETRFQSGTIFMQGKSDLYNCHG